MIYEKSTHTLFVKEGETHFAHVYKPMPPFPASLAPEARKRPPEYGVCVLDCSEAITADLLLGSISSARQPGKKHITFKSFRRPQILVSTIEGPASENRQYDRLVQMLARREARNLYKDNLFHGIPLRLIVNRVPTPCPPPVKSRYKNILDEEDQYVRLELESIQIPYIDDAGLFNTAMRGFYE